MLLAATRVPPAQQHFPLPSETLRYHCRRCLLPLHLCAPLSHRPSVAPLPITTLWSLLTFFGGQTADPFGKRLSFSLPTDAHGPSYVWAPSLA